MLRVAVGSWPSQPDWDSASWLGLGGIERTFNTFSVLETGDEK